MSVGQGLAAVVLLGAAGFGAFVVVRTLTAEEAGPPDRGAHVAEVVAPRFERAPVTADPAGAGTAAPEAAADAAVPRAPREAGGDSRWTELNREAIAALEAGELARAVALFEKCVAGDPDESVFAHNLAEALTRMAVAEHERTQPCAVCVAWLDRAIALAPERDDLPRLRARWRDELEVEDGFWQDHSQHFELSYDMHRDELRGAQRILEVLEDAYNDLADVFAHLPVEEGRPRIRVVLYRRAGFQKLTGLGDWAGGSFDGTVRVPVEDLGLEERRLVRVLRHELVHVFVRSLGGTSVPGWLNEGLAQYFEPPRGVTAEREVRVRLAREALAGRDLFPLERLRATLSGWEDPEQITLAYHQSIAFTAFLAEYYGERVLIELVAGCGEGATCEETFLQARRVPLDVVLGDLQLELR